MVSISLCSEMETEPCCEEHQDPAVEPTEPEVREAISEISDKSSHSELPCGPAEEGDGLRREEPTETESCTEPSKSTEIKSPCDGGEPERREKRKLKKTNSWKMVRFQDPSEEDDVLEKDTSAESLFPGYATEEWTSSTFEKLFMAENWQDITGQDMSVNITSHAQTHMLDLEGYIAKRSLAFIFIYNSDLRRSANRVQP